MKKHEKGPRPQGSQPTEVTWTPEMDAKLTQLRSEGVSIKQCGRRFKLGEGTVGRRARALGLPNVKPPPQMKPEPKPEPKQPPPQPLRQGASTLPPLPSLLMPLYVMKGH